MTRYSVPNITLLVAMIIAIVACGRQDASATVIDAFSGSQQFIDADRTEPDSESAVADGGTLGGHRKLALQHTSDAHGTVEVFVNEAGFDGAMSGLLDFSADVGVEGSVSIIWDGTLLDPISPIGLGGFDLTDGGRDNALMIDVPFDDHAVQIQFTVYSDENNVSEAYTLLPGGIYNSNGHQQRVFFSEFTPKLGDGADFENVGAFVMTISSVTPATDLQIASIVGVPEPGSLALITMGGLGMILFNWRRARSRRRSS